MWKHIIQLSLVAGVLYSVPTYAQTGKHDAGSLDMTDSKSTTGEAKDYTVLPLARGQKLDAANSGFIGEEVKDRNGQPLGTLDKLIMDAKTGKIEYGVLNITDTHQTWPILWNSFKVNKETGEVSLNLTRDQLPTMRSIDDSKDLSPDVKKLMKNMQTHMGNPTPNAQGLGITKQPASGGGMGEDKAGGAGPSGPRADPLSDPRAHK